MRCVICKQGSTIPGEATVTLERSGAVFIFKSVPAEVCDNCGECYYDEATTKRLLSAADTAARAGVQIEVRSYAAA